MRIKTVILILGLLFSFRVWTQEQSKLNKVMNFTVEDNRLEDALFKVAAKGDINLFYQPAILPQDSLVSVNQQQQSLKIILSSMLPSSIEIIDLGTSILLQQKKIRTKVNSKVTIVGKIVDQNGDPIKDALIFEVDQLNSVRSSTEGKFSLTTKQERTQLSIAVSKQLCVDTLIQVSDFTKSLKIELGCRIVEKFMEPMQKKAFRSQNVPYVLVAKKVQDLSLETNAKLYRKFQFSFIPRLSTNQYLGGVVENSYSLNMIGGYSLGLHTLEIGGAFNIIKGDAKWLQIAGAMNLVGQNFEGVQISGGVNHVIYDFRGLQIGGGYNRSGKLKGLQLSGGVNIALGHVKGFQLAGGFNRADNVKGMQLSGGLNDADTLKGFQLAPINRAKVNAGVQLGVVNLADSASGTMIGIVNIAKKGGISTLNISASVLPQMSLTYKIGTPKLYSIYALGGTNYKTTSYWNYGLGFGFQKKTPKQRPIHYEFMGSWFSDGFNDESQEFGLAQLKMLFGSKKEKARWLYGPTINGMFTTKTSIENLEVVPFSTISIGNNIQLFPSFEVTFKII